MLTLPTSYYLPYILSSVVVLILEGRAAGLNLTYPVSGASSLSQPNQSPINPPTSCSRAKALGVGDKCQRAEVMRIERLRRAVSGFEMVGNADYY